MIPSSSEKHIPLYSYNLLLSACLWQCLLSMSSATTQQDWERREAGVQGPLRVHFEILSLRKGRDPGELLPTPSILLC